ncbi:hypothetical protein KPL76_03985 [Subtercola sp. PAMC28395]|uniref:sensor histidine kinase n=1 Tax=Subtercola sp. PAMC28395 TaxID=2846775 RepID=UPI001C0DC42E|nr:sensor histidine kinase [Subtercola sp. PAMC28395]QWT24559.1 hypothetical protein KPL76_03985 [Subtercola sp. PAMC28395]
MSAQKATIEAAPAAAHEAETRMRRLTSFTLGIGALIAFGSISENIVAQLADFHLWWSVVAISAAVALPLALAVASRVASRRTLRALAGAIAITYLAALLTLTLGTRTGTLPPEANAPWMLGITPIAAIAAALAFSMQLAWAYCGITAVLVAGDRILAHSTDIALVATQDALVALLVQAVFTALVLVSLSTARTLDHLAHQARMEMTERAVRDARLRQRVHASSLVHDHVLATLLLASRDESDDFRPTISVSALNSLTAIARYAAPPMAIAVSPLDFAWRLQATTTQMAPFALFEYALAPAAHMISVDVAETLSEAAAEALRNSLRHAGGSDVNRAVRVDLYAAGARIVILDDGAGFDLASVPESRLGLRVSITQRVTLLPGGRASILSRPGEGTIVSLEWNSRD